MPYASEYWDQWVETDPGRPAFMRQFLANRERYEQECEAIIEVTAKTVINRHPRNRDKTPFFLHIEALDPHEPWDPPKRFLDEYMPDVTGPTWWGPPYSGIEVPQSGIDRLGANYAGESMWVDHWIGEILATVGELRMFDNSMVVFFSDHGSLLGEPGQFRKGPKRVRRQFTHHPFLVRLLGKEKVGNLASGFIHHPDAIPTLFSLLELDPPPRATGKNLRGWRAAKRVLSTGWFRPTNGSLPFASREGSSRESWTARGLATTMTPSATTLRKILTS